MPTPVHDRIKLQFRRDIADLYDSTTGQAITAATQSGYRFTSAELDALVVRALHELQYRFLVQSGYDYEALAAVLPEYVKEAEISAVATATDYEAKYTLPTDLHGIVRASLLTPSQRQRVRMVPFGVFHSLRETRNREKLASPKGCRIGAALHVVQVEPLIGTTLPKLELTYFYLQPDVTSGGATDILISAKHESLVLSQMALLARVNRAADAADE